MFLQPQVQGLGVRRQKQGRQVFRQALRRLAVLPGALPDQIPGNQAVQVRRGHQERHPHHDKKGQQDFDPDAGPEGNFLSPDP